MAPLNHTTKRRLRAGAAGIVAAVLMCALITGAPAGTGLAGRRASSRGAPALDWLAWLTDDLPAADASSVNAPAAPFAGRPAGAAARWRGYHDGTAVPRERSAPSDITRISLPPPSGRHFA
jgi:hypothetical protein